MQLHKERQVNKKILTNLEITSLCGKMGNVIRNRIQARPINKDIFIYPIPRGGIPVAYMLMATHPGKFVMTDDPLQADVFVDDIVDSGATKEKWTAEYPDRPFYALIDKGVMTDIADAWIVFPWEGTAEGGIHDNITRLLQFVGENPEREGLKETPARVAKAWQHWCGGYDVNIPALMKTFKDGADGCDEMVVVRDIPFYSHCEHHLAPFFGTATVAYIPDGQVVGLSKIPRVVNAFARRLQVQERLTNQIADALQTHLKPKGVGVIIKARHLCMESRGIEQQGHSTTTSALRGVIRELPEARAEFLSLK